MAIGNIQLDGIVFRDRAKTAMLRLKNIPVAGGNASSPFVSVRVGEMVNDYRVAKIDVQSVTLEKSGQTYTIGLFSQNKVASPASPQPSSAPPVPALQGQNRTQTAPNGMRPPLLRRIFHGRMPRAPSQAPAGLPPNRGPGQAAAANH
ncbi:MAG: hypothetical protein P4L43_14740 [Syntrophobacteraceae bacterium]|nr:hypothetical protein [Syntrophobacteraceae bacterium]